MKRLTKIRTARDSAAVRKHGGSYQKFVEQVAQSNWEAKIDWSINESVSVLAEVNNSSWIVACPFCSGAILHEPGAPFYCPQCMMEAINCKACYVVYPENRAEIEAILMMRDDPATRNWKAYETADDLRRENIEHGIFPEEIKPVVKGNKVLTMDEQIEAMARQPLGLVQPLEKPELPVKELLDGVD